MSSGKWGTGPVAGNSRGAGGGMKIASVETGGIGEALDESGGPPKTMAS